MTHRALFAVGLLLWAVFQVVVGIGGFVGGLLELGQYQAPPYADAPWASHSNVWYAMHARWTVLAAGLIVAAGVIWFVGRGLARRVLPDGSLRPSRRAGARWAGVACVGVAFVFEGVARLLGRVLYPMADGFIDLLGPAYASEGRMATCLALGGCLAILVGRRRCGVAPSAAFAPHSSLRVRSAAAAGGRVLGGYLVSLAAVIWVRALSMGLSPGSTIVGLRVTWWFYACPLIAAAVGVILLRHSRWFASLATRGALWRGPRIVLTFGELRAFAFGVLAAYAGLQAAYHFWGAAALRASTDDGDANVALATGIAYLLLFVVAWGGPGRLLRFARGLRRRPDPDAAVPVRVRDILQVGWLGLALWMVRWALETIEVDLMHGRLSDLVTPFTLGAAVPTALAAVLFARAAKRRGPLRSPAGRLALELGAVLALLHAAPRAWAFFPVATGDPEASPDVTWVRVAHSAPVGACLVAAVALLGLYFLRDRRPRSI